ncbi:hypothetical protein BDV11DRAFT_204202 [Aspergillus similis]
MARVLPCSWQPHYPRLSSQVTLLLSQISCSRSPRNVAIHICICSLLFSDNIRYCQTDILQEMDSQDVRYGEQAETSLFPPVKRQKTSDYNSLPSLQHVDYTIAWICALSIEMAAARAMLDEVHQALHTSADDSNTYTLGRIAQHNVVIACLPAGQYGTNNAANIMTNMKRTFPRIRAGLIVGIGGGVPGKADVRLGDLVVGTRVMQYDLGKMVGDGQLHPTAFPRIPHPLLGTAVSSLRAKHELEPSRILSILRQKLGEYPEYNRPSSPDRLFHATYDHASSTTASCDACDHSKLVPREKRTPDDVIIHYGAIASGNQVMKTGIIRDRIAQQLDVICFEMEAAGLMDILPCLPIRGICDYADSHKSDGWQKYAAAVAAAYAREFLEELPVAAASARSVYTPNDRQCSSHETQHERWRRLLESLRFDQIDSRKSTIKTAHAKTCRWFLSHPDYQAWLNPEQLKTHHGFLWITGKPGAGKSTIMKFAYLDLKNKARHKHAVTASFFFNARGELLERSILGMYRSLLLQLLEGYPDLQAVLDDADLVPPNQNGCPSLNALKGLFWNAIAVLGHRPFTCFVDALDECDEQQVVDMVLYFEELAEKSTVKGVPLRICFSSRHYPYIIIRRGIRHTLEDQPGHAEDMKIYVSNRLQIGEQALREELQPQLLSKAAGVFMWVVLVVDILNKEYRRGGLALRKRLAEIPSDLSELFRDILRRDNEGMEHLLLCILWILYAKRPLQPKEFYHALCDTIYTKCVISSSKGLAEITKSQKPTIQFIHESVRDFLIKNNGVAAVRGRPLAAEPDGHMEIPKKYPFLEYATRHVLDHANAAAKSVPQDKFLSAFPVSAWVNASNLFEKFKVRRHSPDINLFYLLAEKGLSELIKTRLRDDQHIHVFGGRYRYPFFAALANCNRDAAAALLMAPSRSCDGVDITRGLNHRKDLKHYETRTPLSWAAQEGRAIIVKLLLQSGSSLNEVDLGGQTPLLRALENGHEAVARLLIEHGSDVNASDTDGRTPLIWASQNGHEAVARLLIDHGADVNASGTEGRTPLIWALENGHEAVARLLIGHGADVKASDKDRRTPLIWASNNGHGAVARLLIDKGADVNARDTNERTPLIWALLYGHEAVARLLIDHGADANASDTYGRTPLILASQNGLEAVTRLLINHGADVNARDTNGRTLLIWALLYGHEAVARLLIDHGADVNARDTNGRTPLIWALLYGRGAVARLLIDKEADVNASDKDGRTPLIWASQNGLGALARLLIDKGADVNVRDEVGRTPLIWASQNGHENYHGTVPRLLIDKQSRHQML